MNSKNVVLFAPGPFGGAEKIVLNGMRTLKARLWLIRELRNPLPCEEFMARCRDNGIQYKIFDCKSRFDLNTRKAIAQKIRIENIGLIHSHGLKANLYCSTLPVKKIATQHGRTSQNFKMKFFERIEDIALNRMDALICVSKQQLAGNARKNTHLVENFIAQGLKKQVYAKEGKVKILYAGRLSQEKGILELLKAMEDASEVELTIIGDGPERRSVEQANNINIKYHGFQNDISPYIIEADAIVMPSHREGLPLTAIEAASAGLPILASSVGALPDLVSSNGVLFKPKNPKAIIMAIECFKRQRHYINDQAKRLAPLIGKKYSAQRWAEETMRVYDMA